MARARFMGVEFNDWVVGYKISACWVPRVGFAGNFFVYLWQRTEAGTAMGSAPDLGDSGPAKFGSLELLDGKVLNYKFNDIDIDSIHLGATRATRYRLFEFRYTEGRAANKKPDVTLTNSTTRDLQKTATGEEYKYKLSGEQNLLGFRARVGSSDANVFRFTSLAREENSFLKKVLDLNKDWVDREEMKEFTVNFSQGDLKVTPDNLAAIYVDESWGRFLKFPLAPVTRLGSQAERERNTRFEIGDYSQTELLELDHNHAFEEWSLKTEGVQTTSIVFTPNSYRNFKIK